MSTIDVLEWSLNLSSSLTAEIPDWVFPSMRIKRKSTTQPLPDIIFLNEVVSDNPHCRKLLCDIEAENYQVICSNNIHGNQVAIAISKEFMIKNIVRSLPHVDKDFTPNFLHLEVEYKGIIYNIVAVRIRVNSNNLSPKEFKHRKIQFECYKTYISNLNNVISAGDFNHARICGDENKSFNKNDYFDKKDNMYRSQVYYNYQMIREEIEYPILNLKIKTPKKSTFKNGCNKQIHTDMSSIGLSPYYNTTYGYTFKYPTIPETSNLKIDHIVISKNIKISQIEYNWCFLKEKGLTPDTYFCKGKNGEFTKDKSGNYIINKGFPDHAQLRATIELPD